MVVLLILENDALTGSFTSLTFSILFVTLRMANPMMFSFSSILMNTELLEKKFSDISEKMLTPKEFELHWEEFFRIITAEEKD